MPATNASELHTPPLHRRCGNVYYDGLPWLTRPVCTDQIHAGTVSWVPRGDPPGGSVALLARVGLHHSGPTLPPVDRGSFFAAELPTIEAPPPVIRDVCIQPRPVHTQCGGAQWTGDTCCVAGATCTVQNEFYSQCLPRCAVLPQRHLLHVLACDGVHI